MNKTLEDGDKVKCERCDGCGKIASGEEGAPWSVWADMPLRSVSAVLLGIVKPIECPECKGRGVKKGALER